MQHYELFFESLPQLSRKFKTVFKWIETAHEYCGTISEEGRFLTQGSFPTKRRWQFKLISYDKVNTDLLCVHKTITIDSM